MHVFNMIQPGPLLYLSVWLFPFIYFFCRNQATLKSKEFKYLYIISLFNVVLFFIGVRTLYWYLLPVFPFTILTIPLIVDELNNNNFKLVFLVLISGVSMFHSVENINPLLKMYSDPTQGFGIPYLSKNISTQVSSIPNHIILDTIPHPHNLYFSMLPDVETTVVRDNYYFYTSQKSFQDMLVELEDNGVNLISIYNYPTNPEMIYEGCALENQHLAREFVSHCGTLFYNLDGIILIYKLSSVCNT